MRYLLPEHKRILILDSVETKYYPAQQLDFKVLVRCFTYNQSKYIEDALNGFAMQQTNFPFVCLVMDDASSDGEQDVIKKWLECECDVNKAETIDIPTSVIIIVPHKNNPSCVFAFYMLKQNLYSIESQKIALVAPWREKCEYEAMCEGDDYWIDPLKLQKQVDFLDNNPEYGMCYTDFDMLFQDSGRIIRNVAKTLPSRYPMVYKSLKDYIKSKGYVAPMSWVIRSSLVESYEPIQNACDGTYCMFAHYMNASKVHYLKDVTCVYRVLKNSASRSESQSVEYKRRNNLLNLQLTLLAKYGYYDEEKEYCINSFYKENILFFAENNILEEIKLCIGNCQNLTIKDYIILKLGSSFIGSRCLKYIHHQWGRMKGY